MKLASLGVVVVFCLGISIITVLALFSFQYSPGYEPGKVVTRTLDLTRIAANNNHEDILKQMLVWPAVVRAAHTGSWDLSKDPKSIEWDYLKDCWNDRDWFRMYADPHCSLLWMRVLEHSTVEAVDRVLGVVTAQERKEGAEAKAQQNGGVRTSFQTFTDLLDMRGYWKPCRDFDLDSNSENFASEIIAFHIDRVLGFYRTPAVVPRVFSKRQLYLLADQAGNRTVDRDVDARDKFDTVLKHCGRFNNEYADGAMVGWSPKEIMLLAKHKNKELQKEYFTKMADLAPEEIERLKKTKFNIHQGSSQEDINWVLENVSVNIFAILTNNFGKFGHNLFIQTRPKPGFSFLSDNKEYGPFLFLDNDRSKWKYDVKTHGKTAENPLHHPLATFCKFPRQTAIRMLLLHASPELTLGKVMMWISSTYEDVPSGMLFDAKQAEYMDISAEYVTDMIEHCLAKYSEDQVLFDEPWAKQTDFVTNVLDMVLQSKDDKLWADIAAQKIDTVK